jgi:hypothetical protein
VAGVGGARAAKSPPIEHGRDEIEQDRVGGARRGIEQRERLGAVAGLLDFEAELTEYLGDLGPANSVIFHE